MVLEASGGYERSLTEALARAGTAFARVNPRQGLGSRQPDPRRMRGGRAQPNQARYGIFHTLKEAKLVIEGSRRHPNTVRPHSALGWRPPAPEAIIPIDHRPTMQ